MWTWHVPILSFCLSLFFLIKLSVLLSLPSTDDTSKSMLSQKCLNIFTSAVRLQVSIFLMSLMLLITMYCCSVHVFFFPAFGLTAVRQESAMIMIVNKYRCLWFKKKQYFKLDDTDIWKMSCCLGDVGRCRNHETILPPGSFSSARPAFTVFTHPSKDPHQKALRVYEGSADHGTSAVQVVFQFLPWWLWMCANWNMQCNQHIEEKVVKTKKG